MNTFAMTPVQEAYWVGRQDDQPLGGIACHMYFEFDGIAVEPARLERAMRTIAQRHPMLRARFTEDGGQGFATAPAWPGLTVHDLTGRDSAQLERRLLELRRTLSHRTLPVTDGQVFDLQLSLLPRQRTRVHLDIDHLAADPASIRLLLAELGDAYDGGPATVAPPTYDFARHVAARQNGPESQAARDHWARHLPGGAAQPPRLPLSTEPMTVSGAHFTRRETVVSAAEWQGLRRRAAAHDVSVESVLLAVYAHTLGRWSALPEFTVSVPTFPRRPDHPGLSRVVGDFTALTVLPFSAGPYADLAELARTVEAESERARRHGIYNGVRVLRELAGSDAAASFEGAAVFTSLTDRPWLTERFRALLGEQVWALTETPQVLVDFQVYAHHDGLRLVWDAPEQVFSAGVLDAMAQAAAELLMLYADGDWARRPPDGLPADQAAVRDRVNAVHRPSSGRLLHQRFFELAARAPDEPALAGTAGTWTRGRLSQDARRIAAALVDRGSRPGDAVAVSLPPGPDQVSAVLGVLAAGGCYVPVGLDQPPARRRLIYRTAGARLLIGTVAGTPPAHRPEGDRDTGEERGPELITLEDARGFPALSRPVPRRDCDLAYVIFTSGSTGTPKGVEIEHRAVVNTLEDINSRWAVGPGDRAITLSALDFDLSVYDIFGLLGAGGAVVVLSEDERRSPERWLDLMDRHRVTVWNSVPVLVDMLLSAAEAAGPPRHLRLVITGGDWIGVDLPGRLHDLLPDAVFVGSGGATEASIYSNHMQLDRADPRWKSLPYGLPLSNQRFRVVDPAGRDCPDWVPGELWIGGAGVARGYRGDPDRTAAQFVAHQGHRWYRTGDRARYRPEGLVEFLGREDLQVKINGYRIELGEVEATLAAHPQVTRAVTVVVGTGSAKRIAAFVTSDQAALDLDAVRRHMAAHQPAYCLPALYFQMPELPVTANGKVDRRTLAQWSVPAPESPSGEPPDGDLERALARQWQRLLDRPVHARDVSFFELGGNSMLGMRLIRAIEKEHGHRISMRTLYTAPSIAALAQILNGEASRAEP
ncbi:amino acid adenylation domain-containing protein [Spirillospora sp. NPDC127200]